MGEPMYETLISLAPPVPRARDLSDRAKTFLEDPATRDFALLVGAVALYGSERPWELPCLLADRLKITQFDADTFSGIDRNKLCHVLSEKPSPHVDPGRMSSWIKDCGKVVMGQYSGGTSWIWNNYRIMDATRLARRLTGIPGIGTAKATVFTFLLLADWEAQVTGWEIFEPPVDERVSLTMRRLGMGKTMSRDPEETVATLEGIRALTKWHCLPSNPRCGLCPLTDKCCKQGV